MPKERGYASSEAETAGGVASTGLRSSRATVTCGAGFKDVDPFLNQKAHNFRMAILSFDV